MGILADSLIFARRGILKDFGGESSEVEVGEEVKKDRSRWKVKWSGAVAAGSKQFVVIKAVTQAGKREWPELSRS